MPEVQYQVCRALEGCQVSYVPNPETDLVYLMEGVLELGQAKCIIFKTVRLSPEVGRRGSSVP